MMFRERDWLGALRALHLHVTPRSPVSSSRPCRVSSRPGVKEPDTIARDAPDASTQARQWAEATRESTTASGQRTAST